MDIMIEEVVTDGMVYMDDMSYMGDMGYMEDMSYMEDMGTLSESTQQIPKINELMSSWVFVGGVAAGVLVLGVLFGLLAAKRKIKKGIDLYED